MAKRSDTVSRSGRRSRRGDSSWRSGQRLRALRFEPLEDRTLLSVVPALPANWQAQPTFKIHFLNTANPSGSSSPSGGLIPNQVRGAYGLGSYTGGVLSNGISFGGIQGDGRGQTIAIVDAYDYLTAANDLNAFSTYYALPTFGGTGNPTFTKLNQSGGTSLPSPDSINGWGVEASLDIEWAHAMAPMANIILFESNTASFSDMFQAVQTAASTAGVVAVSMSWGGNEFSSQTSYDNYIVTPSGHLGGSATVGGTKLTGGVTFLASSGDYGAYAQNSSTITPQYPANSPNVVSVGGTTLTVGGSNPNYTYGSESTWGNGTSSGTSGGGGGGISKIESQPSYQSSAVSTFSTTKRTYPDISALANPYTGVPIYDSYDFGTSTPWVSGTIGGTSLACPLWAGMIAVADQGRATAGLGSLDGRSQTLPLLYKMAATNFHDISTGSSIGTSLYNPGIGYDLASGWGSPVGNLLIPQLVGGPSVATPAAASPSPVNLTTTNLSVLGADSGGESTLNYTWAATTLPSGATAPTFSVNTSNAAKNTTATFNKAGIYGFTVTITDTLGLSITSSLNVTVNQTLSSITVSPGSAGLNAAATQQFTATGNDQFGAVLTTQPTFTWTTTAGSVTTGGLLTASNSSIAGTVTATNGAISGSSTVTVANHAPTVVTSASTTPNPINGTTTALSVLGADADTSEGSLIYSWAATTLPSGAAPPIFTVNGSHAAKNTTATFSAVGDYGFTVTITDPGGLSTTSTAIATVIQGIAIVPATPTLASHATQQFTVTGNDQFGAALNLGSVTWSASKGLIDSSGFFTAPYDSGSVTVTASSGAYSGTTLVTVNNAAPTVATVAAASPSLVTDTTTALSVLGADDAGESNLTYTWTMTGTPPAVVSFSANGSNAAQNTTVTFTKAGSYIFQVTITDAGGLSTTSSVGVSVSQTLTSMVVAPATPTLASHATQQFSATSNDQFGNVMSLMGLTWSATPSGSISNSGLFTAPYAADSVTVTASSGAFNASTLVTVTNAAPTVATVAAATPNLVTGSTAALSVLGADDAGEANLTYTWTTTGTPPAAVSFSTNSSNAAKNTTATFTQAGNYSFLVTIADAGGLTTTSSTNVTVNQSIVIAPATSTLASHATQQFTITGSDQFGTALSLGNVTWSTSAGSIDNTGFFTAPYASTSVTVTASSGSFNGTMVVTVNNAAPTVTTVAAAAPSPVTGKTTALSVLGADDAGELNLTYTWTTTGTPPAAVSFSTNSSNAAKNTTATFTKAGSYNFQVTISDAGGLSTTSIVSASVSQTLTSMVVAPATPTLASHATQQFTATGNDQFGTAMSLAGLTWSAAPVGSISSSGLFTAPYASASVTVTATSGSFNSSTVVTVTNTAPTVATAAAASPSLVTGTTTALSVLGADDAGASNLTYTWTTTGTPPAAVSFSANGSNAAKNTTATFTKAGSYNFQVAIADAGGLTTVSSVTVVVNLTVASINLLPNVLTLPTAGQQQFTATTVDQFGNSISPQPALTWTATNGSISTNGLYDAPATIVPVTVTAASGSVNASASVTLVAPSTWWKFDDGSGTNVSDSSGSGHAGTVSSASAWTTAGKYGGALQFNGSSTSVTSTGANLSGAGDFTLGAWVKTSSTAGGVILEQVGSTSTSNRGQYQLLMNSGGTVEFWVGRSTGNTYQFDLKSTKTINDGQWHYVTGVRSGTTGYLYIDSAQAATPASGTSRSLSSSNSVSIGAETYGKSLYFNGTIDDVRIYQAAISGSGIACLATATPTIATAAFASPSPVTSTTAGLSVLGADDAGESNLTYTWAATGTPPAAVTFSANGTNAAKGTTATFTAPGVYNFSVLVADAFNLKATSSVSVTVNRSIVFAPATPTLASHATQQFTVTGNDQFGAALSLGSVSWSASAGLIDNTGFYTAPYATGPVTVTASSGSFTGSTVVKVNNVAPTVATVAAASPSQVTGTTASLSVQGADDAGEANLTYTWTTTGTLPAAVSFSANSSNAAKNTTATFTKAGNYNFQVTISDAGGLSTTSSVIVNVNQTLTSISVQSPTGLAADGTEQFVATGNDQFGMALANQPQFVWSLVGNGAISATGVFTPSYTTGTATIQATSNSITGSALVTLPGAAQLAANSNVWNTVSSWTSTTFGSAVGSPGLRGVTGDGAVFNSAAGGTVNLDGVSPSLANVTFNSTGSYTIAQGSGGTLHLANGPSPTTLTVAAGSHTISAPVALDSSVIVLPTTGSRLTISGGMSGTGTLTVNDRGTVVLTGTNSYTGGTTVSAGTLILTNSSAIAANTSLTVGAGGTLIFDPSLAAVPSVAATTSIASSAGTMVTSIAMPNDKTVVTSGDTKGTTAAPLATKVALPSLESTSRDTHPRIVQDHVDAMNNNLAGGNVRLPNVPLFGGIRLGSAHPPVAVALGTPTVGLAWLQQVANGSDSSDQHPRKDLAIRALDALFAQYGR